MKQKNTTFLVLFIFMFLSQSIVSQHRGLFVPNGKKKRPAFNEKRIALVIGNKNYQHFRVLGTPVNDAYMLARVLRNAGFETEVVVDATRAQMLDAINRLKNKVSGRETVALLYYAGHGVEYGGKNYLIPIDDKSRCWTDLTDYSITLNSIHNKLNAVGVALDILILDACRNQPLPFTCPSEKRTAGNKGFASYEPKGTFISFSTAPGATALDRKQGTNHSPYAYALANAINQKGLKIEDVFKQVKRDLDEIGQQAWDRNNHLGDFYFFSPEPQNPKDIDSDGDGLTNSVDRCPNQKGPIENHGCPTVVVKPRPIPRNPKKKDYDIRQIQDALKKRRYYFGPIDNIFGAQLKAALIKFQKDNGLPVGELDDQTLKVLGIYSKPKPQNSNLTIRQIQDALKKRGYNPGPVDNIFGAQTKAALIKFQKDNGLFVGKLDVETLTALGIYNKPNPRNNPFFIRQVQNALKERGYNPGPIDNIFGAQPKAALIKFQKANGLPVGKLDDQTLRALGIL